MGGIIEHVRETARLTLAQKELGEADALTLATLAYMAFDELAGEDFGDQGVTLGEAAQALLACHACTRVARKTGERDRTLLAEVAASERFAPMRVAGFVDRYDGEAQEQFSAVAFLAGEQAVIAYRGTDGTIVGWKEDFNMSFEREVPAQRDAVLYARRAARALRRPLTLCGHSKGGNLAAYAALFAPPETPVRAAYSFDGPGFNERVAATEAFRQAGVRVHTFVPEASLVGALLWHSEPVVLVRSSGAGALQHDPYTWLVQDGRLVRAERQNASSAYAADTARRWLARLPEETRRRAIDALYAVIGATGERSLRELLDIPSAIAILQAAAGMDGETRAALGDLLPPLLQSAAAAAPGAILRALSGEADGMERERESAASGR